MPRPVEKFFPYYFLDDSQADLLLSDQLFINFPEQNSFGWLPLAPNKESDRG